jgi:hypothetical protein
VGEADIKLEVNESFKAHFLESFPKTNCDSSNTNKSAPEKRPLGENFEEPALHQNIAENSTFFLSVQTDDDDDENREQTLCQFVRKEIFLLLLLLLPLI